MMAGLPDRFWNKIAVPAYGSCCWVWVGTREACGYGRCYGTRRKQLRAHRIAYEALRGPIPAGLEIDHLCRNRACVNPWHLEAVTSRVNILRGVGRSANNARKTHCQKGHALQGDNLYVTPSTGARRCKACKLSWERAYRKPYYEKNRRKILDSTNASKRRMRKARKK